MVGIISQSVSPKRGEWVKGKLVGSGSFGTVHLAMDNSTGGLFVVKSAHTKAGFGALENEVKILRTLDSSPYVVQCLGSERDGLGNLNVLMEYMSGGSLSDVAEKFGGSLHEQVVRLYTKEILKGLNHLHHHGIVHCDLKCKNVLLGSSGDIKLADFGCAKRLNDLKNGSFVKKNVESLSGTPLWMAPEVLRNEKLDFAADIWSLGCTVIEMATGKLPWVDNKYDASSSSPNPMAAVLLRIAIGDEKPKFPENFSEEGLDFLSKCLERDSKKRWTCEELLRHPFVSSRNPSSTPSSESKPYCACSPASVLGGLSFEDSYYDLDELESPEENYNDNGFSHRRSPFTWCKGNEEDNGMGSSENWITVRSG